MMVLLAVEKNNRRSRIADYHPCIPCVSVIMHVLCSPAFMLPVASNGLVMDLVQSPEKAIVPSGGRKLPGGASFTV
jgi:hypothetical protein